ncbi:MAG: hypothetical protein CVU90_09315 [Firmicutes bacterium HGW-Firmicutes-15]|nr:MAG: hypothetical protein CVU90_09315 [Firmicutes bacterium HGW-Firmicutes-15]
MRKRRDQDPESWLYSRKKEKNPDKMRRQNNILLILVLIIMIALIFNIGGIETAIKNALTRI